MAIRNQIIGFVMGVRNQERWSCKVEASGCMWIMRGPAFLRDGGGGKQFSASSNIISAVGDQKSSFDAPIGSQSHGQK